MKIIFVLFLTISSTLIHADEKAKVDNAKKDKRGLLGLGYGYGADGLIPLGQSTHTHTTITRRIALPVAAPYPVTVDQPVAYPYTVNVPLPVDRPYPVHVSAPYPVAVDRPVAVAVDKPVVVPVPQPVAVPVAKPVAVPIPAPYTVPIVNKVAVLDGVHGWK